jgi:uncharacterized protein YbaP (TraB family)
MPSLNLSRWILPLKAVPAMALALLTGLSMAAEPAAEPAASCPPPFSPPTPAEVQAMAPHMQDRGLLWRVQDGERTSWLYGTLHVGKREWILPGRTIVRSMYGADLLALELDVLNPQVMQQLIDGFQARVDAPALPAELEARLAQHRKQACAEHLSTQRPDAQLLGLVSQLGRKQGLVAEFGADLLLAGMAHALHKPVLGLESAQTQLEELLSDDPLEVQESVRDGLDQLDDPKAPEILQQLANIWASGNENSWRTMPTGATASRPSVTGSSTRASWMDAIRAWQMALFVSSSRARRCLLPWVRCTWSGPRACLSCCVRKAIRSSA